MKEQSIIFNAEMVRAILDGRKSQTRRVCKLQPQIVDEKPQYLPNEWGFWHDELYPNGKLVKCPYGLPGDHLWLRETWQVLEFSYDYGTGHVDDWGEVNAELARHYIEKYKGHEYSQPNYGVVYRADAGWSDECETVEDRGFPWRPSIHIPRWASRITLEVTGVRVERVQDISYEDAVAEGIPHEYPKAWAQFRELWDSINAKRNYGWDANPWVWVVEFERRMTG